VSRHYSYPLKAGHDVAYLCTETTDYQYLEKLDAPKKWFKTHIDFIMQTYGGQHQLQKEDLFLGQYHIIVSFIQVQETNRISAVIGTLSAPNYALFVSHRHSEGHVNTFST
jgi:abelson tyrosine-protein kinase 1